MQTHEDVQPSGLEFSEKSFNSKGKRGMVLYTAPKNNHALLVAKSTMLNHNERTLELFAPLVAKSTMSNHNETTLELFNSVVTVSCLEVLFNFVSLCYYYQHNKDYQSFKAAGLKLFAAKRPFETTQVKRTSRTFQWSSRIFTTGV